MIDPENLEKLQNISFLERITVIEVLVHSLKNDLQNNVSPQPEYMPRPQRPTFGFMKDTGKILGDIVAPVLSENEWEVRE